jgi:hypothetical protein
MRERKGLRPNGSGRQVGGPRRAQDDPRHGYSGGFAGQLAGHDVLLVPTLLTSPPWPRTSCSSPAAKAGPFRVEPEPVPGAAGSVAVWVNMYDEGAADRLATVGSYLFATAKE